MINIVEKKDCCGCTACVQKCPRYCITLDDDNEGFLYPQADRNKCIDCGLCEKVCPWLNTPEKTHCQEVLAVKNRNEEERMASSSGGVFILLAKMVLKKKGVVFGAVFDKNWEVEHIYAETLDGVKLMMGSKYLQSRIGDSYRQAEKFLKEGRKVLFTGSPCQIAGLHNYLRKDYANLLSVDFLCHGVPSPGIWRKYLDETFNLSAHRAATGKNTVLFSSLSPMPVITGIEFRDKKLNGWKKYSFVVRGKSALEADKNSVLLSDIYSDNPFMKGFLADIYLRPSCYDCKCKNGGSHSDLTIADFWGVQHLMPDFDDDKGIGLVLVSSEKGKQVVNNIDVEIHQSNLQDASQRNGGFKEHINQHPQRASFFRNISKGMTVMKSVEKALHIPIYKRIYRKFKHITKRTLKLILR